MGFITRLRHRIGKWIWKENDWTKAVEDIENAVYQLRSEVITKMKNFLREFFEPVINAKTRDWIILSSIILASIFYGKIYNSMARIISDWLTKK